MMWVPETRGAKICQDDRIAQGRRRLYRRGGMRGTRLRHHDGFPQVSPHAAPLFDSSPQRPRRGRTRFKACRCDNGKSKVAISPCDEVYRRSDLMSACPVMSDRHVHPMTTTRAFKTTAPRAKIT